MFRMVSNRGRPRSETARRAILDAALELVVRDGYGAVTMDGLAAAAGVGKQTIYRWWPSRADVMFEAIHELAEQHVPAPDRGSLREDLAELLAATFASPQAAPAVIPILRGLMAEAQTDDAFRTRLREELLEPRRAVMRAILVRARERGELRAGFDLELAIDVAFGVMWYRLLTDRAPLDRKTARQLAQLIAGHA